MEFAYKSFINIANTHIRVIVLIGLLLSSLEKNKKNKKNFKEENIQKLPLQPQLESLG